MARASAVAARGVPAVFAYQSPSTTVEFRPAQYVDIGPHMARKLELIKAHASQCGKRPYLEESFIRATAAYWGRHAGFRLVEPLEIVRAC